MIGRSVGWFFTHARDAIARRLVRLGVTPNGLTIFGALLTVAAGVCLAVGVRFDREDLFVLAGVLMYSSAACDMLDGAVARVGKLGSDFGGFLDSTLDRVSDFALFGGLAFGYAWRPEANLTFLLLCGVGLLSAMLISYTKARAEDFVDDCSVGFWKRGERIAAILIASFACNPGAAVLLLAASSPFTVWRRIGYTRRAMAGKPVVRDPRREGGGLAKLQPWLYPRMSWPYDLITLSNIAFLIFFRFDPSRWDLLRTWMG